MDNLHFSWFLHSQFDATHVLSNILVISLVGIPLEQRLGWRRFTIIYFVGLIGGSVAWVLFNFESSRPALGASGAAFGLFGAYLAGWPKDEIPFPLILIRKWPVFYLALIYFALEVMRAYSIYGLDRPSDVGHMAHLGGFILAYVLLTVGGERGPVPLGIEDGGPSSSSEVNKQTTPNKTANARPSEVASRITKLRTAKRVAWSG